MPAIFPAMGLFIVSEKSPTTRIHCLFPLNYQTSWRGGIAKSNHPFPALETLR